MNPSAGGIPNAASLEADLRAALAPRFLEVLDESAAHAGHAGANELGGLDNSTAVVLFCD